MEPDILTEAYESILGEAPVDDIGQIRSTHFTTDFPEKSKFKKGDKVEVSGNAVNGSSALAKFPPNTVGTIVGMQQHTGAGAGTSYSRSRGMNRYYVKMPDNKIYPVSSMHVLPIGTGKAGNPYQKYPISKVEEPPRVNPSDIEFNKLINEIDPSMDIVELIPKLQQFFQSIPEQYKGIVITAFKRAML